MIFLTGGTGFLGRHLVPVLCRTGASIRLLTRHPASYAWLARYPRIEVIAGELQDESVVANAMQGCTQVIHAGGMFRFWGDEKAFTEVNVRGTENVLNAALSNGIERLVHVSTVALIGHPDPTRVIDETESPYPADPYQRSKWAAEQIVHRFVASHQLPAVIVRPGAYYGPLGYYAFNRLFFKDPMRGIIMQVNGGRYIIFPAFISDVAQGVLLAMQRGKVGEVYNMCGDWISHQEAFDIVCEEAGLHWLRLPIPGWMGVQTARFLEAISMITRTEPFWPLNLRSYVYNNWRVSSEKARRELGFKPTTFRDGARQTIAWYRAGQPEWLPELECPG